MKYTVIIIMLCNSVYGYNWANHVGDIKIQLIVNPDCDPAAFCQTIAVSSDPRGEHISHLSGGFQWRLLDLEGNPLRLGGKKIWADTLGWSYQYGKDFPDEWERLNCHYKAKTKIKCTNSGRDIKVITDDYGRVKGWWCLGDEDVNVSSGEILEVNMDELLPNAEEPGENGSWCVRVRLHPYIKKPVSWKRKPSSQIITMTAARYRDQDMWEDGDLSVWASSDREIGSAPPPMPEGASGDGIEVFFSESSYDPNEDGKLPPQKHPAGDYDIVPDFNDPNGQTGVIETRLCKMVPDPNGFTYVELSPNEPMYLSSWLDLNDPNMVKAQLSQQTPYVYIVQKVFDQPFTGKKKHTMQLNVFSEWPEYPHYNDITDTQPITMYVKEHRSPTEKIMVGWFFPMEDGSGKYRNEQDVDCTVIKMQLDYSDPPNFMSRTFVTECNEPDFNEDDTIDANDIELFSNHYLQNEYLDGVGHNDISLLSSSWLNDCNEYNYWCEDCDKDRDGFVSLPDYATVVGVWGMSKANPFYDTRYDIWPGTPDGIIDFRDYASLAEEY